MTYNVRPPQLPRDEDGKEWGGYQGDLVRWTFEVDGALRSLPGGVNGYVQFNDNGGLGGDVDFTWNKTTNVLNFAYGSAIAFGGLTAIENVSGLNNYTRIRSGTSGVAAQILVGGSADPANYYYNTAHNFATLSGGTALLTLNATSAIASVPVRLPGSTVANLPGGTVGDTAFVTDALGPAFGAAVVGGGAVRVPVFRNATVWVVG